MESTVTIKGQVVIPKDLRVKYDIRQGNRVHFAEENGRIYLVPVNAKLIDQYAGILKSGGKSLTKALLEERRKDRISEDKKAKRWSKH